MSAIDPSKVKAGDTVTATVPRTESFGFQREPYEVTGVTYVGSTNGSLWVGPVELSGRVTITDHQPAPEREWRVGAMYRATVHDDRDVEVMFTRGPATRTDERDAYYPWYVPSQDDFYHEVTDVRPLVVIDPARVDWRGLQAQMSVLVVGAEPFKRAGDILAVVRRELGIEAS